MFKCARLGLFLTIVTRVAAQQAISPDELQKFLDKTLSTTELITPIRTVADTIYNNPEISRHETGAHKTITTYLIKTGWKVIQVPDEPTAFAASYENHPANHSPNANDVLPVIGLMVEYDALSGSSDDPMAMKHGCGHHLITYHGILAATLARKALEHFGVAAKIRIIGTPDEEDSAGKARLDKKGVFDDGSFWLMAHPTVSNAIQPMGARHTAHFTVNGKDHHDAVHKTYSAFLAITDLKLPATGSSSSLVIDIKGAPSNVVQTAIKFGVHGADKTDVDTVHEGLKQLKQFSHITVTPHEASDRSIVLSLTGPGGHAAKETKGPLDFSIEFFRILKEKNSAYKFSLPDVIEKTELKFFTSVRTRWDLDQKEVDDAVLHAVKPSTTTVIWDTPYLSLEPSPYLGQRVMDIMTKRSEKAFPNNPRAPAASDAGYVQHATYVQHKVGRKVEYVLQSERRPTLHANFGICNKLTPLQCPFNHELGFHALSGTEYAYEQTGGMAVTIAQIAVELAAEPTLMHERLAVKAKL